MFSLEKKKQKTVKKKISFFSSLRFKIPIFFGVLFLLAFQGLNILFSKELEQRFVQTYQTQMIEQSNVIITNAKVILNQDDQETISEKINQLLQSTVGESITNIQLLRKDKTVLAVSNAQDLELVGKVNDNAELDVVLSTGVRKIFQFISSDNEKRVLRIVAPILSQDNQIIGALILDSNVESVYVQINNISQLLFNSMLLTVIVVVVFAIIISHLSIVQPIMKIKEKTEAIAEGNYDATDIKMNKHDELGNLSKIINELAVSIKEANVITEYERQRLDSVLTHMSDGVIATDRRGNVVIINDAAIELLNIERKEKALQLSIMDLLGIRDKYSYRELMSTTDELILSIGTSDEKHIIKGEFSVIKRSNGFISGLVCVLTDITEQEKIDAERREFVSNVSHELRTPLTSLKSYIETLVDGAWEDKEIAPKFLKVIQSESERMIRMVTDLLTLSKMDSGRQVLQLDIVDITSLLKKVLDRYDMLLASENYKEKHYKIIRRTVDFSLFAEVDQDRIIQVLDNLLNNAIKYSPDGGEIIVRLIETEKDICISVTDSGLGIPRQSLNKIFTRFYRVDKARSRKQGGTGLGLAISKEVIELHRGKIWVNSIENNGSTFFISLPKVDIDNDLFEWE